MAEDYVRPPLVAFEPPSPGTARWRFRLVVGLAFVLVLGGLALLLFTVILANTEGNPGLNPQGFGQSAGLGLSSTVAAVPPPSAGASSS